MMKKLLALLLHLLQPRADQVKDIEDETWKNLDGAEFLTILPENNPQLSAE